MSALSPFCSSPSILLFDFMDSSIEQLKIQNNPTDLIPPDLMDLVNDQHAQPPWDLFAVRSFSNEITELLCTITPTPDSTVTGAIALTKEDEPCYDYDDWELIHTEDDAEVVVDVISIPKPQFFNANNGSNNFNAHYPDSSMKPFLFKPTMACIPESLEEETAITQSPKNTKRVYRSRVPDRKAFTTETEFTVCYEAWRSLRARNNKAVRKTRGLPEVSPNRPPRKNKNILYEASFRSSLLANIF